MFSRAGLSNCKVCINRAFFSSLSGKKLPYIEKAKLHGVQSLLGQFSTSGFYDDTLKNLNILKLDPNGDVLAKFQVDESQCNSYKTLHGGHTATLVDVIGTLSIISVDVNKPGVSVDLNVTYLSAASLGETVLCKGKLLKLGNSLGFTEITLEKEKDGTLIAIGRHTKAFPKKKA